MKVVNKHSRVKVIQGLMSARLKQEHTELSLMSKLYTSRDRRVSKTNQPFDVNIWVKRVGW